jgi:hypothetical protein
MGIGEEDRNSETTAHIRCAAVVQGEGVRSAIVVRRKAKGARESGRMKEGGKEEQVYIFVQAARRQWPEAGALNRIA